MAINNVYIGDPERVAEQATFDFLPKEVRDAVNDAPISFQYFVNQAHQALAAGATVQQVVGALQNACRDEAPTWRPLQQGYRRLRRCR